MTSGPVRSHESHHAQPQINFSNVLQHTLNAQNIPKSDDTSIRDEQIISVRITSSVAVGRTKPKTIYKTSDTHENDEHLIQTTTPPVDVFETFPSTVLTDIKTSTVQTTVSEDVDRTEIPPSLIGANLEFLKQLQAKKETRGLNNYERVRPFHLDDDLFDSNQTNDSIAESSVHSVLENDELINDVPLARSVPLSYSSKRYIQDPPERSRGNSRLTSVNFNVVHDSPKVQNYDNDPVTSRYINPIQNVGELQKYYNHRPHNNVQFSQPSQIYSEPAKFYSEPAKIYSEPAKIYSEPAKIYSEPSKIYSEPAKFYSPPASLNLSPDSSSDRDRWQKQPATSTYSTTVLSSTPNSITGPPNQNIHAQQRAHEPEKNYEIDEKVSVMTDGRAHGEQPSGEENCKQENCKVGYVVEGRQFRKYRVEERTSDGFIVGEYGVVRNEDGALRGVRYTADSDASPRLIHDALMKFLQLK